jgi:hypothetical protein
MEFTWALFFTGLLILLAAVFNSLMDLSSEDRFGSDWWDKTTGSANKWKNGDKEQGEAFFLSSTALVWLTDGWHLFQFMFHTSWQLAIAINLEHPIWFFIALKVLFSMTFEFIYSRLKDYLGKTK